MTKPPRQFYSIIISGPFAAGKTTFIKSACAERGTIMLNQSRPSTLGCVEAGQFVINEQGGVYLYETYGSRELNEIPGKCLGIIVIVNNRIPQTFREAKSIIEIYRTYARASITIVANVHSDSTGEPWTQQDFRLALQIDSNIPILECDVSDEKAVKSVLDSVGRRFLAQEDKLLNDMDHSIKVVDEQDFFSSKCTHQFITVVSAQAWYSAHYFMDLISDHKTWLKLNKHSIPRRWGYCEIDSFLTLHFIPVEHFGSPKDSIAFAVQHVLSMTGKQPPPSANVEDELILTKGTIGCVGLFNSHNEASTARAKHMIKAFGDYPYVIIDTGEGMINQPTHHNSEVDEVYLGSRHPIMRVDSGDKDFPRRAICLLNEQLTGIEAEKLRTKFSCL